jgi:hypothetical protein
MKNCKQHNQVQLKQKKKNQKGEGVISDTYDAIKRRVNAIREGPSGAPSSRLKKFINENNNKIVSVQLGKKPIIKPVHKFLDAVSFGRFSKKAKELNYDSVFHNYLIITLDNGKKIKLEKNAIVEYKPAKESDFKHEIFDIPLNGKELTLTEMINKASDGKGKDFWKYSADRNNCQEFTRSMIVENGLLPETDKTVELQDAKELVDTLPFGSNLTNSITNTAAVGDRLLHGDGVDEKSMKDIYREWESPFLSMIAKERRRQTGQGIFNLKEMRNPLIVPYVPYED